MYENNSFESTTTKHCILQRQVLIDTVTNALVNLKTGQLKIKLRALTHTGSEVQSTT